MVGSRFSWSCRVLITAIAWVALAASASAQERPWRIVVLNGSDPTLPAFIAIDQAMRAALLRPDAHPVEIYYETLDVMRFPGAALEPAILEVLRLKYGGRSIDAVIAVAPGALEFAQRHRRDVWPGAYVLFHNIALEALRGHALPERTTGIAARFDFMSTAELALRLRPATRRLVVIAGSGEFDQAMTALAKARLEPLRPKVALEFWSDRRIGEFVDGVAGLPADSTVLLLSIFRDAEGRLFTPRDALAQLAAVSRAPIFSVFDTYVGSGAAGGYVDDYELLGRRTAELVEQTLAAPPGAPLPAVATLPAACVADARELRRWNIAESVLPDECTIRFGEVPVWRRYWWQIAVGAAIIASQSLLIAALALQRRRRLRAEIDTHAARNELVHAARLASMGELTASIAHEIKQPLSAILAHADTAELLLESESPPLAEIQQIVARIRSDDLRANDVIARLRDLLGKRQMEREAVNVNEAVADTLHVLEEEARRRSVAVDLALDPEVPPIEGDRVHLQQVVLNLVLNALDAVATIPASTRRIAVRTAVSPEGVEIAVADNGPGIDAGVAGRLFESFVTTKPHGLGLGLSITRSIVEAHGGSIAIAPGTAGGTVFRVVLPLPSSARPPAAGAARLMEKMTSRQ